VGSVDVLGTPVDCVDMAAAVAEIERLLAGSGPCRLVVTVNPESVMRARRDADFAAAVDEAALRVPDGWGSAWALRRGGCDARAVPGVDLAVEVAGACARHGWSVFLLGGAPGVAQAAGAELVRRHAGLKLAGCEPGSPAPEDDEAVAGRVAASGADLVLVAYGQPRQELWIHRNAARLPARAAIGVGGTFDYLSGRVPRAPGWMRAHGLEWLFRLVRQPWRARRMAVLPVYALLVLRGRGGRGGR
jgi:N-acetylglucosaminyldiphosphoundecaprenol N-acetyl-beta-D-mannosaminyltransferase